MTKKEISFYDKSNIDTCPWPSTEEGECAKRYLEPLIKNGVCRFVDNIETQMGVLLIGSMVIPLTVNEAEYNNSFVCSPYSHYVSYAGFVLNQINNRLLKKIALFFLKGYETIMKRGSINKVVIVNNWLFTTNPSPKIADQTLKEINVYLKNAFPNHAILFRSITKQTCSECYDALKKNGYHLIASRYMYILNAANESVFHTRIFKSDLKFFRESDFKMIQPHEIPHADAVKLQELYRALYIEKYSKLNPQFNKQFVEHLLNSKLLEIRAVKENGDYIGVVGYFCRDQQMMSPLFGYNPLEEKKGVYRYLSTILLLEAQKHHAVFNQSAGGSFYKKIRRATGEMEYTAVYMEHLPISRKIPWFILKMLINTIGKYKMKKY